MLVPKIDADKQRDWRHAFVGLHVPLATYLGWNQHKAGHIEDEYCGLQGSTLPQSLHQHPGGRIRP